MKNYLVLVIVLTLFACNTDVKNKEEKLPEKMEQIIYNFAKSYFTPLPDINLKKYTSENKLRIELGKKLFYDKRLSEDKTINCASCHDMTKFGVDNLPISPGDKEQFGTRNTPTVLNAYLQYAQFWDARERTVEDQAAHPIFGNFEMDMPDTLTLLNRLNEDEYYTKIFPKAFPQADTSITIETIKLAIGAFERILVTPAPIDDYLKGDMEAISSKAKLGIKSFIDNGCIPCHSTNLIGGQMAQKFSLYGNYWDFTDSKYIDKGRFNVTGDSGDKFVFKVPLLRNIEKTSPYMHDGSVVSMEDAIKIMAMAQTNLQMKQEDVDNIVEFFKTLTGKVPDYALEENPIF